MMKTKLPLLLISLLSTLAADEQDSGMPGDTTDLCANIFDGSKDSAKLSYAQAQKKSPTDSTSSKDHCCVDSASVYTKIFGGANFLQETTVSGNSASYQAGYIFAGSLGYCWQGGVHVEAEYAFRRNGIDKIDFFTQGSSKSGHFQTSSYMANVLWYLPLCSWGCSFWKIRPLFG